MDLQLVKIGSNPVEILLRGLVPSGLMVSEVSLAIVPLIEQLSCKIVSGRVSRTFSKIIRIMKE